MAESRKSSLINTIFKCLALAQPAVINHTGRESATLRPEARGFFYLNEVELRRYKIDFKRSSFSLMLLGIIIVNKLAHRSIVYGPVISEFGCDRECS